MTTLMIPELERKPFPSLGPQVVAFIEANLIFGPGDLRGMPARVDAEKRALISRMYEVYPAGDPRAGRRRFRRCALSLRKGTAKTELAAWIAAVELHPEGPVRCDGFDANGQPVGRAVKDPYIPMVAYTEEQTEELAYGALYAIISEGPLADDFDIGLERIMRTDGHGKAVALATAPNSADGARTTFEHFDETHRFVLPRLKDAHKTMLANLPKRQLADPWALETTTSYSPGESSVAESTMEYARQVANGHIKDSRLFFFHRQANEKADISTEEGLRAAVVEASGPAAEWSDIDGIVEQFRAPDADRSYLERVWLNRLVRASERAFDMEQWRDLATDFTPAKNAQIVLGFDGSRTRDSTALIGCDIATGTLFPVGIWYPRDGYIDVEAVETALELAFERYDVWWLYADPPYWESQLSSWMAAFGEERVVTWETGRPRPMTAAVRNFATAIAHGELRHNGDKTLTEHVGNCVRHPTTQVDEDGKPMWTVTKERPDSVHKIDGAVAAILAWEAYRLALREPIPSGDRLRAFLA